MTKKSYHPGAIFARFAMRCFGVVFPILFVIFAYNTWLSPTKPISQFFDHAQEQKAEIKADATTKKAEVDTRIDQAVQTQKDKQADRKTRLRAYADCVEANDHKLAGCEHLDPRKEQ